MDYSKDKKMYGENMSGQNPNAGEDQIHWSGHADGNSDGSIVDSAGVSDGLSSLEGISVKNAEMVTANQRPESNTEKAGMFTMGVS